MDPAESLMRASRELCDELAPLRFAAPVSHVYNPLEYARAPHFDYLRRFAAGPKHVIYLGMNPGPFGMAQTGVPFGEVSLVREFLGVRGPVTKPAKEHPKRVIDGFACSRSEVSGARLWGAIRTKHPDPAGFFAHAFVANYCPLVFMEDSGRNRTPDKLLPKERAALYLACDRHLRALVDALQPKFVIGVGKFAESRAREALSSYALTVASIPHPSPASPAANRGWAQQAELALHALGIEL
jgi:single-strand selective monofunctional uracil DNA glycosylase